jgi:drug/metabolite transporter (DMT)-like permease
VGLARRPDVSPFSFLAVLAATAFVTSIPLMIADIATGGFLWPTRLGLATLAYAAIGPAFLSQLWYLRGVALIGPGRAGVFVNLVPIFGALMGVALLGEQIYAYHVIALALVAGGVALAQYAPGRAKSA